MWGHTDMYLAWVNSTHLVVGEYGEVAYSIALYSSLQEQDPVNRKIFEENVKILSQLVDPITGILTLQMIHWYQQDKRSVLWECQCHPIVQ